MDKVSAALEEPPFIHCDIPGDLLHPGIMGMWRDAGDLHTTAVEMDEEQHEQFALLQMNLGREVSRRLRESDERMFLWRVSSEAYSELPVFIDPA